MSRIIALVDLDDTLFQSRRKWPADVPEDRLTPLGFAADGALLGFATPRQLGLLSWLSKTTLVVPVTARSLAALRRVRMRFGAAICAHGGLVLDENGIPDPNWSRRIHAEAQRDAEQLRLYAEAIASAAGDQGAAVRGRVLAEDQVPLYVVAKHDGGDEVALHALVTAAVPELPAGWTRHVNGNNVALLPPWLGKQHAVRYLLDRLRVEAPDATVIGIGDSHTDAAFMHLCDFAMLPTRSQLAERLFRAA